MGELYVNKETTKSTNIVFLVTSQIPAGRGMGRALGVETIGLYLQNKIPREVCMQFVDLQYEPDVVSSVDGVINNPDVDIIGISVRYGTMNQLDEILFSMSVSERFKQKKHPLVIVGGVMPSFLSEKIVEKHPFVVVAKGEGELTMYEITQAVRRGGSFRDVAGITYMDQGKIVSNESRRLPLAETSVGGVIPDLLDKLKNKGGIIWVLSSRGCPWDCSFCSVSAFREFTGARGETKREIRPVKDVISELKELYNYGFHHFVFADDEMLVGTEDDLRRWHQLADGIKKIGDNITFQCSVRSDVIWNKKDKDGGKARHEALHALVESGMSSVYIGFESGSPTQLKRYNKGESVETHYKAIEILREEGVLVGGGFIMFDPEMTLGEIQENIDFIRRVDLISTERKDFIGDILDILRVQRGAAVVATLKEKGLLRDPVSGTLLYNYEFQDPKVKRIAETCNALTEEIDSFFEALKYTVFAKTQEDENAEETKLLNQRLIELRLLDLSLLESLIISSKAQGKEYETNFDATVLTYRMQRKQIIQDLLYDIESGKIGDKDVVNLLTVHIMTLPDFIHREN